MKEFTPKKVFILQNGEYVEITFSEHICRRENDDMYKTKKFIGIHSMIMEVCEKDYYEFYRTKRRQKYLAECAKDRGDLSYDALTTDEFNGEIYYANLCPVLGSEQGGIRPVLILQNDKGNKYSPITIVAAITSRKTKAKK